MNRHRVRQWMVSACLAGVVLAACGSDEGATELTAKAADPPTEMERTNLPTEVEHTEPLDGWVDDEGCTERDLEVSFSTERPSYSVSEPLQLVTRVENIGDRGCRMPSHRMITIRDADGNFLIRMGTHGDCAEPCPLFAPGAVSTSSTADYEWTLPVAPGWYEAEVEFHPERWEPGEPFGASVAIEVTP